MENLQDTQVELGGYIGYSCILYADAVRKAGGKRYFSLERDPVFGAVIASLVDLAGLSDLVKVIIGSSAVSIQRLHNEGTLKHVDMMFLDHYKPAYKTDLKLCEELKIVTPGTVLAADNVIAPGNPPYLEYVRSSVAEKRKAADASSDESNPDARFADRTSKQYANRQTEEKLQQSKGNPNLVYESKLSIVPQLTGRSTDIFAGRCRNHSLHWRRVFVEKARASWPPILRECLRGDHDNLMYIRAIRSSIRVWWRVWI
jgi:catechol O-methyltransferase